jgi:integrase
LDSRGNRKAAYSWKLVPTDRTPAGKKDDLSLREKEKIIERDMDDGIDTARAARMTLNELFQMYMEGKTKLKEKSRSKYKELWDLHVKENRLGNMAIGSIKKSHIQKFYAELSQSGHADGTIRMFHNNLLRPTLEFAVDNDLIRKNPTKGCLEGYDATRKREALTWKEQQIFLDYIGSRDELKIHLPMIQIMIGTACRISEICGLTWNDVDMKNRSIRISHQMNYERMDGEMKYFISTPKTESGNREIPMTEQVYKAFVEQKKLCMLLGRRGDYELDGYSGFVFLNSNQRPYNYKSFNYVLYGIVKRYNAEERMQARKEKREPVLLPVISSHILRHTGCTRMAEAGMDVKVLQTIMGHSDPAVTMKVYNHVDKERMKKEIRKIDCAI